MAQSQDQRQLLRQLEGGSEQKQQEQRLEPRLPLVRSRGDQELPMQEDEEEEEEDEQEGREEEHEEGEEQDDTDDEKDSPIRAAVAGAGVTVEDSPDEEEVRPNSPHLPPPSDVEDAAAEEEDEQEDENEGSVHEIAASTRTNELAAAEKQEAGDDEEDEKGEEDEYEDDEEAQQERNGHTPPPQMMARLSRQPQLGEMSIDDLRSEEGSVMSGRPKGPVLSPQSTNHLASPAGRDTGLPSTPGTAAQFSPCTEELILQEGRNRQMLKQQRQQQELRRQQSQLEEQRQLLQAEQESQGRMSPQSPFLPFDRREGTQEFPIEEMKKELEEERRRAHLLQQHVMDQVECHMQHHQQQIKRLNLQVQRQLLERQRSQELQQQQIDEVRRQMEGQVFGRRSASLPNEVMDSSWEFGTSNSQVFDGTCIPTLLRAATTGMQGKSKTSSRGSPMKEWLEGSEVESVVSTVAGKARATIYSQSLKRWISGFVQPPPEGDDDQRWIASYVLDGKAHRKRLAKDSPQLRFVPAFRRPDL